MNHDDAFLRQTEGTPYLGLLWPSEIELLRPLLKIVLDNIEHVIDAANHRCKAHFGEPRGVFRPDALRFFTRAMLEGLRALVEQGPAEHTKCVIEAGEGLSSRGVPFRDVVLAIYFYEEAINAVLPPLVNQNVNIFQLLDKLSHIRLALLSQGHSRWGARDDAKEIQMRRQPDRQLAAPVSTFHGIVGSSAPIRELCRRITAAAAVRGTVLLVGESGTGKELVARAIHEVSAQCAHPFVAVNCAAIPRDLIESEFFGYVRGAFSGANTSSLGLFRSAHGGTLFLDEVTEMSPGTQTKVLRAIQERAVRAVGGTQEIPVDVRLIASTNRDPEEAVRSQLLRADLYYRLQASILRVPPLRDRLGDIPLLVRHFINLWGSRRQGRESPIGIEKEALDLMQTYLWPGNVRELSNAIETAATFGTGSLIRVADLPETITSRKPLSFAAAGHESSSEESSSPVNRHKPSEDLLSLSHSERELLIQALALAGGNKTRAAALLQISRKRLYVLIRKYAL